MRSSRFDFQLIKFCFNKDDKVTPGQIEDDTQVKQEFTLYSDVIIEVRIFYCHFLLSHALNI